MTAWEEPKELDTDNEAVISLYDGIRKILDRQSSPNLKQETKIPRAARHVLQCGRILKVDVERKLVVVTVMSQFKVITLLSGRALPVFSLFSQHT